jgi:N-acetylglucosaminyldiphosphoundecaprenol N-acetyl-beta-D-mannosaminyltransferase
MESSQLLIDPEAGAKRRGSTLTPSSDALARRSDTKTDRHPSHPAIARLETKPVLGIPLAQVAYADVIDLVNAALADRDRPAITVDAINTMGLSESCLDPRMRESLLAYDVIVPDGMPVVWCMNAKGSKLSDRVYGPYLTDLLLAGLKRKTRVAVIGGFAYVHEWLRRNAPARYPHADFVLLYDAPTSPVDDAYVETCIERIDASDAELVFICLGVPRQYYWTGLARDRLHGKVCLSVGGAFDFVCGVKPYPPAWVQRSGLTWLHRLSQEPRRLGPRYLKYNSAFLWLLLRQELLRRSGASDRALGLP